jgi:hypothetical protein
MVAHSREKKMSLRDRAQRESFASETLCLDKKGLSVRDIEKR